MIRKTIERSLTTARTLAYRFPQSQRLHARLHPHRKNLGQGRLNGITGGIVYQLSYRTRADWSDIANLIAQSIQGCAIGIENCLVTADPDCQLAGNRALRPTTNRCIETMQSLFRHDAMNFSDHGRRIGGQIE